MNQEKISKFIADLRKDQGLTQEQLAESLGVSNKSVSRWENGQSMPDYSIIVKLCNKLNITVNELLSGEKLKKDQYNEKLEQNLIEMVKQKEQSDKKMLILENILGLTSTIIILAIILLVSYLKISDWLRYLIIIISLIFLVITYFLLLQIEQVIGYYECQKCHYKYIPTYQQVLLAMHICQTRYMKCPKCHEKSWQKKVTSK